MLLKDAMELWCNIVMSDLKENYFCFYVFSETLEKLAEKVPNYKIVTQDTPFLLVARSFIYRSEESDRRHIKKKDHNGEVSF